MRATAGEGPVSGGVLLIAGVAALVAGHLFLCDLLALADRWLPGGHTCQAVATD